MAEPKAEPSDVINLVVKDQAGGEVHFKVKRTTKLEKVFMAYAQKKSVDATSLRFLFDGKRLDGTHTPASRDMEDEDVIDCMTEQVGGA